MEELGMVLYQELLLLMVLRLFLIQVLLVTLAYLLTNGIRVNLQFATGITVIAKKEKSRLGLYQELLLVLGLNIPSRVVELTTVI